MEDFDDHYHQWFSRGMAGHHDGEDFFSDDDLDTLPQNAFDELEQTAIRQTQATQLIKGPPSSNYGDEFDDEDLDDAEVFDAAQGISLSGVSARASKAHGGGLVNALVKNQYGAPKDMMSITGRPLKKEWSPNNPSVSHRPPPHLQHNEQQTRAQHGTRGQTSLGSGGQVLSLAEDEHIGRSLQIQASYQAGEQLHLLQPGQAIISAEGGEASGPGSHRGRLQYTASQSGPVSDDLRAVEQLELPLAHISLLQIQLEEASVLLPLDSASIANFGK